MEGRTDKTDGRPPFDCPPTQVTSKVPYLSPRIREFLPLCTCKFTPETPHRPHHYIPVAMGAPVPPPPVFLGRATWGR